MTDNEIIKAMQCVIGNDVSCSECAYQKALPFPSCRRMCAKNALDLIKRQKAEIERLKKESLSKEKAYNNEYFLRKKIKDELKAMRGAANSYKLELERKEDELNRAKVEISKHFDYMDSAANEALIDFAERLKRYSFVDNLSLDGKETVYVDDVDNLVKKMTEESE